MKTASSKIASLPDDLDQIPRQRWWQLLPRRSLYKALAMLLLLLVIVFLQRRAGNLVNTLGGLGGVPPAASSPPTIRLQREGTP